MFLAILDRNTKTKFKYIKMSIYIYIPIFLVYCQEKVVMKETIKNIAHKIIKFKNNLTY